MASDMLLPLSLLLLLLSRFSRVQLFATPWTAAYHALPSMGFSRQEYWSGVPSPSPPLTLDFPFSEAGQRSRTNEYPLADESSPGWQQYCSLEVTGP